MLYLYSKFYIILSCLVAHNLLYLLSIFFYKLISVYLSVNYSYYILQELTGGRKSKDHLKRDSDFTERDRFISDAGLSIVDFMIIILSITLKNYR